MFGEIFLAAATTTQSTEYCEKQDLVQDLVGEITSVDISLTPQQLADLRDNNANTPVNFGALSNPVVIAVPDTRVMSFLFSGTGFTEVDVTPVNTMGNNLAVV